MSKTYVKELQLKKDKFQARSIGASFLAWLFIHLKIAFFWAFTTAFSFTRRHEEQPPIGPKKNSDYEKTVDAAGDNRTLVPAQPLSVNYHFTRQCNFKCGFCFHTAKSSFVLPLEEAMRGLRLLKQAGMEKVNFSGGEPFIHQKGRYLGQLVRYCKVQLNLPSVSIVSNGSLITESWFRQYGEHLDILAISCDSFDTETCTAIGRESKTTANSWEMLQRIRGWCRDYKVAFKVNTVVNALNVDEDMNQPMKVLNPVRWKVFQCLLIDGENQGEEALRNARNFTITDEQFDQFLRRHSSIGPVLVPESNIKMRNSYCILDERMRFLDCTGGEKKPSPSILDVGVEKAMQSSGFDEEMFFSRGGKYVWSKQEMDATQLDW